MKKKILLVLSFIFVSGSIYSFDVDPVGKNIKEGVQKYKSGDFHGALDNFNHAEAKKEDDPRTLFNKGTAYYKLDDYKLALKYFEKAAETEDKTLKAKALYNKGNTYVKMGDKLNAVKAYSDTLSIAPEFAPARKNLELLRKKEEKKENDSQEKEKDDENEDEKDKQNGKENQDKNKKKMKKEDSGETEKEEERKKLSKEEAERILNSTRQDNIKRRKYIQNPPKNDVFW